MASHVKSLFMAHTAVFAIKNYSIFLKKVYFPAKILQDLNFCLQ